VSEVDAAEYEAEFEEEVVLACVVESRYEIFLDGEFFHAVHKYVDPSHHLY